MGHTDLIGQIDACQGFTQVNNYPLPEKALESEWGVVGSVRFLLSALGAMIPNASSTGQTVYPIFVAGIESYANIQQDQYSTQLIYRSQLYSGPLALNASLAWKNAFAPRLLNDEWIYQLRCTLA